MCIYISENGLILGALREISFHVNVLVCREKFIIINYLANINFSVLCVYLSIIFQRKLNLKFFVDMNF